MAKSASKMTEDAIDDIVTAGVGVTVLPSSTSTDIYKLIRPLADAAAITAADAERVLYALSWLASQGRYLDSIARAINGKRVEDETDNSFRLNAPKLFTPEATIDTVVDADTVEDRDIQLDDVDPRSEDELFDLMKTKFFGGVQGNVTDEPLLGTRPWRGTAVRLAELYSHIAAIIAGFIEEDSEDLAGTDWAYRFGALRAPGVRDAKLELQDYNKLVLYVLLDERSSTDSRGRKLIYDANTVIAMAEELANHYIPKPDRVTLKAPVLTVRPAPIKPIYVEGGFGGTATVEAVEQAIDDFFYDNKLIGEPLNPLGIQAAVAAVPGVTFYLQSSPSRLDLQPTAYEILGLGYTKLTRL